MTKADLDALLRHIRSLAENGKMPSITDIENTRPAGVISVVTARRNGYNLQAIAKMLKLQPYQQDDMLDVHLQRAINRLQMMAEDEYAPAFADYNHTANAHGCKRVNFFSTKGISYTQLCTMAGLKNRPSGPRKGTKPQDPNLAPPDVEAEVCQMLTSRAQWQQALSEFPLQAIPTRTEVYHCTVGQTTYRVTREYASLR